MILGRALKYVNRGVDSLHEAKYVGAAHSIIVATICGLGLFVIAFDLWAISFIIPETEPMVRPTLYGSIGVLLTAYVTNLSMPDTNKLHHSS